ncbi:hypothetical protein [Photobacterium leiognathi]|uniref:hypothetical protein n=1 Tax=Photobacterium leiognathi TaxID=553611 RepID=UPI002981869C|nr:hypothetical protein [Photobacterium leiognathi]
MTKFRKYQTVSIRNSDNTPNKYTIVEVKPTSAIVLCPKSLNEYKVGLNEIQLEELTETERNKLDIPKDLQQFQISSYRENTQLSRESTAYTAKLTDLNTKITIDIYNEGRGGVMLFNGDKKTYLSFSNAVKNNIRKILPELTEVQLNESAEDFILWSCYLRNFNVTWESAIKSNYTE